MTVSIRTALYAALISLPLFATAQAGDLLLPGDSRPWHLAGDDNEGGVRTLELLRPGRNFGNSPEVLVLARGGSGDAYAAADSYLSEKQSLCEMGNFDYIRSGGSDTVYRWEPRGCDFPESDMTEVGRFTVENGVLHRISLRVRSEAMLGDWQSWIDGDFGYGSSWSKSVFGGGTRSVAQAPSTPGECVETGNPQADLDCLLREQRALIQESNEITRSLQERTRSTPRYASSSGSPSEAVARPRAGGCCEVPQIRGLHLQRSHPVSAPNERVSTFTSTDTYVYAVTDLVGDQGGSVVRYEWVKIDEDGSEIEVTSNEVVVESGNNIVFGSLAYNGLTPTGHYAVRIYFDGAFAGSHEFDVVAGSSFG